MATRTLKLLGASAVVVIIALSMGGRSEAQWYPPSFPGYPPSFPGYPPSGPGYPPSGSGRQHISPFTPPVIDPSGGCEGGSCINIPR
jgi:hypothetical protein